MAVDPTAFILDTSAYSAFTRGDARLLTWFKPKYSILVPLIVIGELQAGFIAGSKTTKNTHLLSRFLDSENVRTLPLSLQTTRTYAELFLRARTKGIAVGTNDLWIAALAHEHQLPILTTDSDFGRIPSISTLKY